MDALALNKSFGTYDWQLADYWLSESILRASTLLSTA